MKIGNKEISENKSTYIIGEIGINHNGSIILAKSLIDIAVKCGCDAVKFQKRDIDLVYTKEELDKPRNSVYGKTNGDLKRGLELSFEDYKELFSYASKKGIDIFASPWDINSVDFLEQLNPCCYKIASACITDETLLKKISDTNKPVIISTGMSSLEQIKKALSYFGKDKVALLSCTSTYPTDDQDINLNKILSLKHEFPNIPIGYSGHESDIIPTIIAVSMGACIVERHITISKELWGSDQKASLGPENLKSLVSEIRRINVIKGDGKIKILDSEKPICDKLRRY